MPWTPPPEERLHNLRRAKRLSNVVLVSFGLIVVCAIAATIIEPGRWWLYLIGLALFALTGRRTLRQRRRIATAISTIEAELHQAHTASATPEGR